jgi:hypothetical protein
MKVCCVRITNVIAREAGVAVYRYMGAARSFIARNHGHGDRTQAGAEGVDGKYDYRMAANAV